MTEKVRDLVHTGENRVLSSGLSFSGICANSCLHFSDNGLHLCLKASVVQGEEILFLFISGKCLVFSLVGRICWWPHLEVGFGGDGFE